MAEIIYLYSAKLIRRPTVRHVDLLCIVVLCLLIVRAPHLGSRHDTFLETGLETWNHSVSCLEFFLPSNLEFESAESPENYSSQCNLFEIFLDFFVASTKKLWALQISWLRRRKKVCALRISNRKILDHPVLNPFLHA